MKVFAPCIYLEHAGTIDLHREQQHKFPLALQTFNTFSNFTVTILIDSYNWPKSHLWKGKIYLMSLIYAEKKCGVIFLCNSIKLTYKKKMGLCYILFRLPLDTPLCILCFTESVFFSHNSSVKCWKNSFLEKLQVLNIISHLCTCGREVIVHRA